MSMGLELLPNALPMAADVAGVDTTVLIAAGAMAAGGVSVRKLTPHWHETINEGYRGVLFHRGQPVEKNIGEPLRIRDRELVPTILRQHQQRYAPRRGHFVTEEQMEHGEGRYVTLAPNWYFIGPYCSIQTVNVTDQPAEIKIPFEARDGKRRKQLNVHAEIAWNIGTKGDAPLHAITKIQHEMESKKDTEEENKAKQEKNMAIKTQRVTGLAANGLSRAIRELDMQADELYELSDREPQKVELATIDFSKKELAKYGFVLSSVRLVAVTRVGEEVLGDSLNQTPPDRARIAAIASRIPADENGKGEVIPFVPGGDAA